MSLNESIVEGAALTWFRLKRTMGLFQKHKQPNVAGICHQSAGGIPAPGVIQPSRFFALLRPALVL
jgi:hypothetical protein